MFNIIDKLAPKPRPRSGPIESGARSARDERLRGAFAAAPVGLAVASFDGRWILFNDAAATILGYTREELARVTLHEITHEDDLPRERAFLARMAAGEGQRYQIEKRVLDKLGKTRQLIFTASLLRGRAGSSDSVVYVIEPPQPRVESGRTADGLSNAILDNLVDTAVLRCDTGGTILGWNHGAEEMFGYTREQVVGKNRRILYAQGDPQTAEADEHLRIAAERNHYEDTQKRVTRDGRSVDVRVIIVPFAPEGAVRGFVEVIHELKTHDAQYVANLREQLQIERDSGVTLTRVMETLKTRLQGETSRVAELEQEVAALQEKLSRQETSLSTTWTPLHRGEAMDIISRYAREQRSGLLIFVSGTHQKSIHLEDGRIASCASSDPENSLGERLVRRGVVSEAQRAKALEMAQVTNVTLGRALLILGAMRDDDLVRALLEKIDHDLFDLQSWTEGRWAFVNRLPPRVKPVRISVALEDLRHFDRAQYVASKNGTRYHRENCNAMLRVKQPERMAVVSALDGAERGLSACRLCINAPADVSRSGRDGDSDLVG